LISSCQTSDHGAYIHAQCLRCPPTHPIILLPPPPALCIYAQSIVAALPHDESTSCAPPHPIPSQFTPRRPPPVVTRAPPRAFMPGASHTRLAPPQRVDFRRSQCVTANAVDAFDSDSRAAGLPDASPTRLDGVGAQARRPSLPTVDPGEPRGVYRLPRWCWRRAHTHDHTSTQLATRLTGSEQSAVDQASTRERRAHQYFTFFFFIAFHSYYQQLRTTITLESTLTCTHCSAGD
jgi:hypothetical protein